MSARSLLAFGELYRNGGKTADGRQIVPADWISQSWQQRTNSRFSGDEYGYGWFTRQIGGEQVHSHGVMAGRCSTSCRRSISPSS